MTMVHLAITNDKRFNNLLIVLTAFATTIGTAVPVGYNIGVINTPAVYIRAWCNQTISVVYDINLSFDTLEILWSGIVSIFLVGGAIGSFFGAWSADRFGRKKSMLICAGLLVISAVLLQFCRNMNSVEALIIGRLISGLAAGMCTTVLPLYLLEISTLKLRGLLGTFCGVGITCGIFCGQIFSLNNLFGTEEFWQFALSSFLLFVILGFIPSMYFPESPKYLYIVRGDKDAAFRELEKLRGNDLQEINCEMNEMENFIKTESQTSSFCSVLRNPALLMPLIIVLSFMGGQQLSGINAIFYYSVIIFENAGLSKSDAEWASLGTGGINFGMSLLNPILITKFNRRPLMIISSGSLSILLVVLSLTTYYNDFAVWIPILCICSIFMYIICFQIGLCPIPYFIGSEIFETDSRPIAMSLGSLSSWLCNFMVAMTFPTLQRIWSGLVFLPFSIACILLFIITIKYLPETKNRKPSEIAPLIANGFRSKINI